MAAITLIAEPRTQFGKGAARKIRAIGKIPAVVYEFGNTPMHITLPAHETALALRTANAVFAIVIDGTTQLAVAKDVQRDPIRPIIEHIDFLAVVKGEKIDAEVGLSLVGTPFSGALALLEHQTITVSAPADKLPEHFEIDVDGVEAGTSITAGDIKLPAEVVLVTDAATTVVVVSGKAASTEETTEEEAPLI
jgi:large subunit ribosomal protein L25